MADGRQSSVKSLTSSSSAVRDNFALVRYTDIGDKRDLQYGHRQPFENRHAHEKQILNNRVGKVSVVLVFSTLFVYVFSNIVLP